MSGPITWADKPPRLEESGGIFVLTLESGGEAFRYAMPPHAAMRLCQVGIRVFNDWQREAARSVPVPFPASPSPPATRGKRK